MQDGGHVDGGQAPRARRDPDLGAAYAGIAVGALAVLGATAVGLRWAARPPSSVRILTVGRGGRLLLVRRVIPHPR